MEKENNFGPDFGMFWPKFLWWVLPLLDVIHCFKAIIACNLKENQ